MKQCRSDESRDWSLMIMKKMMNWRVRKVAKVEGTKSQDTGERNQKDDFRDSGVIRGGRRTAPSDTLQGGDTRRKKNVWANLQRIVEKQRGRTGKKGDTPPWRG